MPRSTPSLLSADKSTGCGLPWKPRWSRGWLAMRHGSSACVQRPFFPRGSGPAERAQRDNPLGIRAEPAGRISRDQRRSRPHFRRRRTDLNVCGGHRRHRFGLGSDRGGPRCGFSRSGSAPFSRLSSASRRPIAVFSPVPNGVRLGPNANRPRVRARAPLGALPIERLAEAARLSPRQFGRVLQRETGETPAKAVERLRVEAACLRLQDGSEPIDLIARAVGFNDPERMRRAFVKRYGLPPQAIRRTS